MKKSILFLLLISTYMADAQSLKEALYGGKLNNKPGTVIRKGDDLTPKKDTVQLALETGGSMAKVDSVLTTRGTASVASEQVVAQSEVMTNVSDTVAATNAPTELPVETAAEAKDNNTLLKEYMNSIVGTLQSEVLSSKKVKSGSYYVLVSYAIEMDGQLTVTDVFVSPENKFLQDQVQQRLSLDTPKLEPVISSSGKPRKVNKKYNFTLVKE